MMQLIQSILLYSIAINIDAMVYSRTFQLVCIQVLADVREKTTFVKACNRVAALAVPWATKG